MFCPSFPRSAGPPSPWSKLNCQSDGSRSNDCFQFMTRKKQCRYIYINSGGSGVCVCVWGGVDQLPYLSGAERLCADEGEETDVALRHVVTLNTENN